MHLRRRKIEVVILIYSTIATKGVQNDREKDFLRNGTKIRLSRNKVEFYERFVKIGVLVILDSLFTHVRMAERSKAPDSRVGLFRYRSILVHVCGRGFESHF